MKFAIAMGSNRNVAINTPIENLSNALKLFGDESLGVVGQSRWYRTDAFPKGSGPEFVNAAVLVETALGPHEVLAALHRIEAALGRRRDVRWGARGLDLDLIAAGDLIVPNVQVFAKWRDLPLSEQMKRAPEELILPHPRLQDRAFVLIPLRDIWPDWHHPVSGLSIGAMLANLPQGQLATVRPI